MWYWRGTQEWYVVFYFVQECDEEVLNSLVDIKVIYADDSGLVRLENRYDAVY
jgi:hypothetical protein